VGAGRSAHDRYRTEAATPTAGDTGANPNAGVDPAFTRDVLVATSETSRVFGSAIVETVDQE
jgi:hypothetical protein